MSKQSLHEKATSRPNHSAPVTIQIEVVEVYKDILSASPVGEDTVGQHVDRMIESIGRDGKRLGKITIDLTDYSKAFITDRTTQI